MKKSITNRKFNRIYSNLNAIKALPSDKQYSVCYYRTPSTSDWFEYYHCKETGMCYREPVVGKMLRLLGSNY